MKPLKDLRVVELATVLAGPSVGSFLAELGAEVLKVERPESGDVTRSWRLSGENEEGISAYYASANAGKTVVFWDWNKPQDADSLAKAIKAADVLLTNFRDFASIPEMFRPAQLAVLNPRLVMCQLDGYESTPGRPAYDVVLQAETGYVSMNGNPGNPVKLPLAFMDLNAAHQMKQAILLALLQRERDGKGQLIRCSLERAAYANLANQASNYLMVGHVPKPMGSLHPNIAPYGEAFRCADGRQVMLAVGNDGQFERLCSALGLPELAAEADYSTNIDRVRNRTALAEALSIGFLGRTSEHWSEEFQRENIPAGIVHTLDESLEKPFAQSMIWKEKVGDQITRRMSTIGFRMEPLGS